MKADPFLELRTLYGVLSASANVRKSSGPTSRSAKASCLAVVPIVSVKSSTARLGSGSRFPPGVEERLHSG